jgi:hypothetical protein
MSNTNTKSNTKENPIQILDSFNEYYKLKNNYEIEIKKEKRKIIKNPELSWKEKRSEFKKYKPKCINCKRPVGTIFSGKYNISDEFRELTAICGSATEPCNLNITINPGVTFNIMDHIKELEKDNDEYKNSIIDDKNKLLFGYISSEKAIDNFDKLKDAVNDINYLLNINYETLFQVTDNKKNEETIKKLEEETYILINDIKQTIKNYNSTNDLQFVRDSIEIYINQLEPKLKELMRVKYRSNLVEYNEDDNTYHLIQKKYTILDLEDNYVKPEVISFDYGNITNTAKNTKSKKQSRASRGSKNKQLRIENEEGEGEGEDEINLESEVTEQITTVRPRIQEDGVVIWDDPDYANLWNKLSIQYRDALTTDREWLQETMDKYVQNRKDNQKLSFVSPSNLIFPPQILEDGTYDFGNVIYNKFFNKLDKSYQKTLLTLYTEENGVKNYNMLLNALANIVAKELDFREFV